MSNKSLGVLINQLQISNIIQMITNLNDNTQISQKKKIIEKRIKDLEIKIQSKKINAINVQKKSSNHFSFFKYAITILPSQKYHQSIPTIQNTKRLEDLYKLIHETFNFQNQITVELNEIKNNLITNQQQQIYQNTMKNSSKKLEKIIIDQEYQQYQPFQVKKISSDNSLFHNQSPVKLQKRSELGQLRDFNNRIQKQNSLYLSDLLIMNDKQECNSKGEEFLNFYEKWEDKDLTNESQSRRYSKRFSYTRKLSKIQQQKIGKNPQTSKKHRLRQKNSTLECQSQNKLPKELYSKLFCEISQSLSARNLINVDDNTKFVNDEDSKRQKIIISVQVRAKIAQKITNQIVISQKINKQQSNRNEKYQNNNNIINGSDLQRKLRSELLKKIVLLRSMNQQ